MTSPQVHVPYSRMGDYMNFIGDHRLNLEIYFNARDIVSVTPEELQTLLRKLNYGPTLTVHAPFMDLSPAAVDPGVKEVTLERFTQVFDAAAILRPKAVVFHSGYEKWKYAHNVEIWLEKSLRFWPYFIEMAEDIETKIAIENIFEDEPGSLAALMEKLKSDSFGVCFDTGHMNIFSEMPVSEWLGSIGQYIIELHLHDNHGDMDSHLPVGAGTFDFDTLFRILKGMDLIWTVEATNPEGVLASIERLKRY